MEVLEGKIKYMIYKGWLFLIVEIYKGLLVMKEEGYRDIIRKWCRCGCVDGEILFLGFGWRFKYG